MQKLITLCTCFFIISTHATRNEVIKNHPILFMAEPKKPTKLLVMLNGLASNAHSKYGKWADKKDWKQWSEKNSGTLIVAINPRKDDWGEVGALAKGLMALMHSVGIGEMGLEMFKKTYGTELDQSATALLSVIEAIAAPHKLQEKDVIVAGQSLGGVMALLTSFKSKASFGAVADFCGPPMMVSPVRQAASFTYILYDQRDPKLNIHLFEDGVRDVRSHLPGNAHKIVVRNEGKHTFGRPEFYAFWAAYMTKIDPVNAKIKGLEHAIQTIPDRLAQKSSRQQRLEREKRGDAIAQLEIGQGKEGTQYIKTYETRQAESARRVRIARRQQVSATQ